MPMLGGWQSANGRTGVCGRDGHHVCDEEPTALPVPLSPSSQQRGVLLFTDLLRWGYIKILGEDLPSAMTSGGAANSIFLFQ